MTDARWRGMRHEDLFRMINSGEGPRASTPQLDYWSRLEGSVSDIHRNLTQKLGTLNGGWHGSAGARAQEAIRPLQRWAEDVRGHVNGMHGVAQNQADLVADARARMPEPQPTPKPEPAGWPGPGEPPATGGKSPAAMVASQGADFEAREAAAADARERAIQVMNNYEHNSEANRGRLGVFEEPARVAVEVPAPGNSTVAVGYRPGGGGAPEGAPGRAPGGVPGEGEPLVPGGGRQGGLPVKEGGAPGGRVGIGEPGGRIVPGKPAGDLPAEGGWRAPVAPEAPGALTGTAGAAGGLGAVVGGIGGRGPGRRGGAHRKPEGDREHGREHDREHGQDGGGPQWPGEQDNPDTGGHAPEAPGSGPVQHAQVPQGHAQQGQVPQGPSPDGQAPQGQAPQGQVPQGQVPQGQVPQGGQHAAPPTDQPAPLQPAQHTAVSLDGSQPAHSGQAVDPVQPSGQPQPSVSPGAETGVARPQGGAMHPDAGQHAGGAPMAPMGGGGAGMGAQGPGVRGQSPLMRDASAGNQAFFAGNQPGGPVSDGTGFGTSAQSVGGGYTPPGDGGGHPGGPYDSGQSGNDGGFPGWDDEPEPEFHEEFSEPVSSDTDGFWGDDRRVAPPVLGEFPPQQ